jgi:hypothetical protein
MRLLAAQPVYIFWLAARWMAVSSGGCAILTVGGCRFGTIVFADGPGLVGIECPASGVAVDHWYATDRVAALIPVIVKGLQL